MDPIKINYYKKENLYQKEEINMKKFILFIIIIYIISYFFIGKQNLLLSILKKENLSEGNMVTNLFFISDDRHKLIDKEVYIYLKKDIKIFQKKNIHFQKPKKGVNYIIDITKTFCFFSNVSSGINKDEELIEWESFYVWCFYKWIRIYNNERKVY